MMTYKQWTWIPSEFAYVVGNLTFGAALYKDFEENKYWKYNIVINKQLIVMGEGHFEKLQDAMQEATIKFIQLIEQYKKPMLLWRNGSRISSRD